MKFLVKKPIVIIFGGLVFLFCAQITFAASPPPAVDYAPSLWFDLDEDYYPANPLDFYFDRNLEEIPGKIVKAKYDSLSLKEKLSYFTVFYRVVDNGDEWVYQYWLFYVFNNSEYSLNYKNYIHYLIGNDHYGDFESVYVFVNKDSLKVNRIVGSAHNGTEFKFLSFILSRLIFRTKKLELCNNEIINPNTKHVRVLVEKGGHPNYLDGDKDGLVNPKKDLTSGLSLYTLLTDSVWSEEDKVYGVKIEHDHDLYQLIPLSNFSDKFIDKYGLDRKLLIKSPVLGSFIGKRDGSKEYITDTGGHVTRAPWDRTKGVYSYPDRILPFPSFAKKKVNETINLVFNKIKKTTNYFVNQAKKIGTILKNIFFPHNKGIVFDTINFGVGQMTELAGEELTEPSNYIPPNGGSVNSLPAQETFYAPRDIGQIETSEKTEIKESIKLTDATELYEEQENQKENEAQQPKTFLVKRIIDGDTIVLENGQQVRYIGINAPELPNGCFAQQATDKNKELIEGKKVRLEKDSSESDDYGRLLRYVYLNDLFINDYLVRNGYAYDWAYGSDVRYRQQFVEAEQEAKNARKGLWGDVCHPQSQEDPQEKANNNSNKNIGGSPGGNGSSQDSEEKEELPEIKTGEIVINEIAWMGTNAENGHNDEWIELYNTASHSVNLNNSILKAGDGSPEIVLEGSIQANSYYLLERSDDQVISNIPADQIYTGALNNPGENLVLKDSHKNVIDQVNCESGWYAGDNDQKRTMERNDFNKPGINPQNWHTYSGEGSEATDNYGNYILGTPKAKNSKKLSPESLEQSTGEEDNIPPVVEISITNYNHASSSFNVQWASPEYPSVSFDVEHKKNEDDYQDLELKDPNKTKTTFTFPDNNQIASYYFRVRAKDLAGNWSDWKETSIEIIAKPVVINEIAWMGTASSSYDEWIELYNKAKYDIDLIDWTISAEDESLNINLTASISANGYYLLERTDDQSISNITADQIYTGGLKNTGEDLALKDSHGNVVDHINCESGWHAGDNEQKRTMERINPSFLGTASQSWDTYSGSGASAVDVGENLILGTPKSKNSVYSDQEPEEKNDKDQGDKEDSEENKENTEEEKDEDEEESGEPYTLVDQNIVEDTTWTLQNSPYLIYDNSGRDKELLEISKDTTLTIEAGVIIKFKNPGLKVLGTIKAEGSSEKPIVFTSYRDDEYGGDIFENESDFEYCQENPEDIWRCPQPGHWSGILITESSTDSIFNNVIIRYAGNSFSSTPAEAAIKVENSSVILKNSVIERNIFKGIWLVNSPDTVIDKTIFRNNLYYNKSYSSSSKKEGLRNTAIYVDASSPEIRNSNFENNLTGIYIINESEPIIKNNIFSDNFYPIWFYNSYPQFSNNQMTDNKKYNGIIIGKLRLEDRDYSLGADSVLVNYEKHPFDSIFVSKDFTLTIKPGTIIKSREGTSGFQVEGTLIADGTINDRIIFTSVYDDEHGGDTNADGNKVEYCRNKDPEDKSYLNCPRAGMWGQIIFKPTSKNSFLKYVVIKHAGRKWMTSPNHSKKDYVLKVENSDIVLKNSIIGNNSHGLYMEHSQNSQIAGTIFEGPQPNKFDPFTSTGIYLLSSTPTIDSATFLNNKLGVYISSDSIPTLLNLIFGNGDNEQDIEDLRVESEEKDEGNDNGKESIKIIEVFYDGEENETDEYVEIKNNGKTITNLENWTLADEAEHIYAFESYDLKPGESIKIYTNMGEFSYNRNSPIWNNDGDTAYLKDDNGDLIDSYNY